MNIRLIMKLLGGINIFLGCTMFVPAIYSLFDGMNGFPQFAISIAISIVVSLLLFIPNRKVDGEISHKDGFAVVGLVWISMSIFGALPFLLSNGFGGFTNSLFESISGFTTTGSTILGSGNTAKISSLPNSILLWRSMIQWLGGMGIVLLSMAILPLLGIGGAMLFRAEVPGHSKEKITPRIKETAKFLWWIYLIITALEFCSLMLAGMMPFDAICHSFTTMATGGFSPKDAGIMYFNSGLIEMILTFFMLVAGCNFALHFLALRGKPLKYIFDEEFRWYWMMFFVLSVFVAAILLITGYYDNIVESLRYAMFQVASLMTTTGYHSADFELWRIAAPSVAFILLIAMFLGGMSGSTGGGMKTARIVLLFKATYNSIREIIHPRAVTNVRMNGLVVQDRIVKLVAFFFILYIMIFLLSTLIISMLGIDLVTSVSAVAACLNNIGPGFNGVGPLANFDTIPIVGKWLLMLNMLIGRLELYTIVLLFIPEFWRR